MNENGWILLSRNLLKWGWFDKSEMVHLWIYLLLAANVESKKWHGVTVERGQIVTGRKKLKAATGISEQTIRTCLQRLQDTGEITIKSTKQYTLITICNYADYQDYDPNNQPTTNQQSTNNQPTTNQQLTTTITINNNNNSLSPTRAREAETRKNFFEGNPTPQPTALATATEEKEKSSAQKEKDFTPPTESQVKDFCQMNGLMNVNPVGFVAYYEAVGWAINGRPMKNWRAAAVNWNEREKQRIYQQQKTSSNGNLNNRQERATRHASCEPRTDVSADEF
jgi:biotin operon repressor